MTKCTNCGSKWTTKEKIKQTTTFAQAMICPYCGAEQFLSRNYRKKSGLINMAAVLTFFIPAFLGAPWQAYVSVLALSTTINIILQLHTLELTNKEEYPF